MLKAKKAKANERLTPNLRKSRITPYKEDGVWTVNMPDGGLRVLQLTDVHYGGTFWTRRQDALANNAIIRLVEATSPDLIILTGDNVYPIPYASGTVNNLKQTKAFSAIMESIGLPWACVFGNHDAESFSTATKERLGTYYEGLEHCLFQKGEQSITGVGNYCIKVKNGSREAWLLMLLDSNMYRNGNFFTGFDCIHQDQVEWYKQTVTKLSPNDTVLPSLAFFHMPLVEYKEAWNLLRFGSPLVKYKHGAVGESDNYMGISRERSQFFSSMVQFGSTRATFVGHDHLNTIAMEYEGILLCYGMSIDYLAYKGIMRSYSQRGGTLITVKADNTFDVENIALSMLETGTLGNDVVR